MELVMLCFALFVFFFGSVIAMKAMEFGFRVGDKALEFSGAIMKLPFMVAFKLIFLAGKYFVNRMKKHKPEEIRVRPVFVVSPLELWHMRNNKLFQSGKRSPVVIEHPPLKSE